MKCVPILLLLICLPAVLLAQGTLTGTVVDSASGELLMGANVHIMKTALGAASDREGGFRITAIPAGTHRLRVSYVGYRSAEREITIAAGQTLTLHVRLVPDVIEGSEVLVTAQARGQMAAINQQINSSTIVNVVSEDKIKELPDANAAEAIGRLPGVSILRSGGEANKVILRGMSDKFTTFTLDGVRIPSTDADSRGVDLSTFSQGTLAGVELFKAITADKDADAIAGSVNLVTRKAPAERTIRVDAKGAYSGLTKNARQYDFNGKYGERFLDGLLGVQVTGNIERRDRSNEQINTSIENQSVLNAVGLHYSDLTVQYTDEVRKRAGAGLLLDVALGENGTIRLNNLFSRTDRDFTNFSRDYPVGSTVSYLARDREQQITNYNSSLRGEHVLWDFNLTWGLSFAESKGETPYDYRMWFTEPSIVDRAGMRPVPTAAQTGPPEALIPFAYNNFGMAYIDTAAFNTERNYDKERTAYADIAHKYLLTDQISGELKAGAKYRYKNRIKNSSEVLAPYYLGYYQDYVVGPDGAIVRKNFAGTRFSSLQLIGRNVLFTNFLDAPPEQRSLLDKYALNPMVNRDALRQWYDLNKNGISSTGQHEFSDNPEVGADYYDIIERVQAGYLMNTLDLGTLISLNTGVRFEHEQNTYGAKYVSTALGGFPTTGTLLNKSSDFDETTWLPNFHLTVRPTSYLTFRGAAYRAIARPDFNSRLEKNIVRVTNPRDILVVGNPNLKNAKSWNYEINASVFGNEVGLVTVSAFYRVIDDMFHTVSGLIDTYRPGDHGSLLDTLGIAWRPPIPANSPITLTYSVNSTKPTKVWGFEFEHQANLTWLPGLLSNVVLSYNVSLVRSETWLLSYRTDTTFITVPGFPFPVPQYSTRLYEAKQKLESQPELFGNVALGYDIAGFSGRLSVFFQGDYNRQYSASGRSDPVVQDFSRWDLSLRQRVTPNISVFFNLNNFTSTVENENVRDNTNDLEALRWSQRYGVSADLGIRVEL